MQVTVNIPDELAIEAAAHGSSLESYVEHLVVSKAIASRLLPPQKRLSSEEFNAMLDSLAQFSHKIPDLPDEAISRESMYRDHD